MKSDLQQLTVATPWTWAVVPSGNVIIGLLGSTWMIDTVPSGFVIVCKTAVGYWAVIYNIKKRKKKNIDYNGHIMCIFRCSESKIWLQLKIWWKFHKRYITK